MGVEIYSYCRVKNVGQVSAVTTSEVSQYNGPTLNDPPWGRYPIQVTRGCAGISRKLGNRRVPQCEEVVR